MISPKAMAVLAVLAFVGVPLAQEKGDEQRIAELIEQLRRQHPGEGVLANILASLTRIEDAEAKLQWVREFTSDSEPVGDLLSKARLILVAAAVEGRLEPARQQVIFELLKPRGAATASDVVEPSHQLEQKAEEGALATAVRQRLRYTRTPMRFAHATVRDWAAYFTAVTDVPFLVSPDVRDLDPERTTLRNVRLPVMSVERSLRIIEDQTGLAHRISNGVVVLRPRSLVRGPSSPEERVIMSREILSVVQEVITALGMIGPAAKDAIPVLEKLAEHDDPQIAERARAALRQVRGGEARRRVDIERPAASAFGSTRVESGATRAASGRSPITTGRTPSADPPAAASERRLKPGGGVALQIPHPVTSSRRRYES